MYDEKVNIPLISSRQNQMIKKAVSLSKAEARKKSGMFLAEGARLCMDAALSGISIAKLFFTDKALSRYGAYIKKLRAYAKESYTVEEHVAQLMSQTHSTQGLFCQCIIPEKPKNKLAGRSVVFEDIQDPANLGTALRTAEAFMMNHVILLGERQDIYAPKMLRASMGAVFRLEISEYAQLDEVFKDLQPAGCKTYAAALTDKSLRLGDFSFSENSVVFIGNEGNGLREETIRRCDFIVKIPMNGRAESLNAATAASIIMWEMTKDAEGIRYG